MFASFPTSRILPAAAAAFILAAPSAARPLVHPLKFFEGKTESSGTVKIFTQERYRTRSIGRGRIDADGSLNLVQQVHDEGKPQRERRWRIRQIATGHFAGSMSEATGPVVIDEVGGLYRFRFKMKGHLAVEQWLAPLPGGASARNRMTVRKFGMTVGTGDGIVRKF
ncbi:MAG: DUF3833 family protein [Sphingomicrobium sp.]